MFKKKYTVSMIDSKWVPIKRNIKMAVIPRRDEFVWVDEIYYQVINIVHSITDKQEVLLVVEEQSNNTPIIE